MTTTQQATPGISDRDHRMAAEILACCDPDPVRRREHRRQKLASFPTDAQERVRSIVNKVIQSRSKSS